MEMRTEQGKSFSNIAMELGISVQAVHGLWRREKGDTSP